LCLIYIIITIVLLLVGILGIRFEDYVCTIWARCLVVSVIILDTLLGGQPIFFNFFKV